MNHRSVIKIVLLLLVTLSFMGVPKAQETVEIYPDLKSQKKLKLCATFTNTVFINGNPEEFLKILESAIDKYGIDMVNAHHFESNQWLSYKGYEKLAAKPDTSFISRYRYYYKRIKEKGVYLIISGAEPVAPENIFEKYPEMKMVNNGKFWQFMEDKTRELYDVIPEMDCFEIYLWETPIVNDDKSFPDLMYDRLMAILIIPILIILNTNLMRFRGRQKARIKILCY
jgi:hypothetical protein